jgi:hypothetical protein
MPFATGPWHTPPQLPDDPRELCLVLLFHANSPFRYAAMRYAGGWQHQLGGALEPEYVVSRWAYITSSVERMAELPPVQHLPVESRLFVQDALTDAERLRLLVAYVDELKHELTLLKAKEEDSPQPPVSSAKPPGKLIALLNEREQQLASRDKRIADQHAELVALRQAVQRLTSEMARNERQLPKQQALEEKLAARKLQCAELCKALAAVKDELKLWKQRATNDPQKETLRKELILREKKIEQQRKALVELEGLVQHLKRLQRPGT